MDEVLKQKILKAQQGDQDALNELVKDNMGLVYSVTRRFQGRGYEMEDINQIGAIGLVKAIKKFDFNYNVVLSTFAVTYIIGEIKRFFRDDGPIKISRQIKTLALHIKLEKEKNPNITISQLCKKYNVSEEELLIATDSTNVVESLDDKIDEDGLSLIEKIPSNVYQEEKIINDIEIKQCLNKLSNRDKEIIMLRYYKGQTQKKVADIIGISQVQVSRIEKSILNKLKYELEEVR